MEILELLYQRLYQLQGRITSIQNYVNQEGTVLSRKDYTLKDIPKLKRKMEECNAAIKAIEQFRKDCKKKKNNNKS